MITAETMMVNPTEIAIDMPVDEANIKEKMESMKQRGIIQPVTIWLAGMRIIDGFHRTQAAINLGWDKIPCYVVDCDEDAFWDARIQSAKQHHKIETERLTSWLVESWRSSSLRNEFDPSPDLVRRYPQSNSTDLGLLEAAWVIRRDATWWSDRPVQLSPAGQSVLAWLNEKSKKWGMEASNVATRILLRNGIFDNHELLWAAGSNKLTLGQLLDARDSIGPYGRWIEKEDVGRWIEREFLAKVPAERITLLQMIEDEKRKEAALAAERQQAEYLEREQRQETEQGQAETRQRNIARVTQAAEHAVDSLRYVQHIAENSKDFAAPIAACISDLTVLYNKLFPGQKMRIKNIVKVSNDALASENAALKSRVASLERALNSKTVVAKKIKNASIVYGE